jgi:hypothetical protein
MADIGRNLPSVFCTILANWNRRGNLVVAICRHKFR